MPLLLVKNGLICSSRKVDILFFSVYRLLGRPVYFFYIEAYPLAMSAIFMCLTSVLLLILGICNSQIQKACDPRTFSPADYPTLLTDLEITGSHPLKLRAHSRLVNSTDEITYEGMVLGYVGGSNAVQFSETEALGACRSLGCSQASAYDYTNWNQTDTCEYKCPDGKKANRKCVFMVDSLKCAENAMNLAECVKTTFFRYTSNAPTATTGSYNLFRYNGVNLICRECGEDQ
jgi:hypothetical protein